MGHLFLPACSFVLRICAQSSLEALALLRRVSGCGNMVQILGAPCLEDLPILTGCCSAGCAAAMKQESQECHMQLQRLNCGSSIQTYVFDVVERCLGVRPSCLMLEYQAAPSGEFGP